MTSMMQSINFSKFSPSKVYVPAFQPPIELLLKPTKKTPTEMDPEKRALNPSELNDPLVVFDHELRKARKLSPKDGIFYYLCSRPSILMEVQNKEFLRPRKLRMLICITMNSQSKDDYDNTINGIYENMQAFKKVNICNEDIAVVTIIDGCLKMDYSMIDFFKLEDRIKNIDDQKTLFFRSKIFESPEKYPEFSEFPRDSLFMYQTSVKPNLVDKDENNYLNVFNCIKLKSSGKLSSHLWFFRGFCEMFNPEYCALIECGTKPGPNSLFEFFKTLEIEKNVGAVTGYTALYTEPTVDEFGTRIDEDSYKKLDIFSKMSFQFFDLQKAQVFEYAFEHIIDKNFQSYFGFLHCLPSHFSCYRWDALAGDEKNDKHNIIDDVYLKTILNDKYTFSEDFTLAEANMHLAEDRILSLEIFSKEKYTIKYVPDAICWTLPSKYLTKLMDERRIKINGSWFALKYLLNVCWKKVLDSRHNSMRILWFYVLMLHSQLSAISYYFAVSIYFIVLHFISNEFFSEFNYIGDPSNITASASGTIMFLYMIFVGSILFCSLIYKGKEGAVQFHLATTGLGFFNIICFSYLLYLVIVILIFGQTEIMNKTVIYSDEVDKNLDFSKYLVISNILQLRIVAGIACCCYLIPMFLNPSKSLIDIVFSFKDYIFYFPMYIHTLLIYSFCNIDDLSCGTKIIKTNPKLVQKSSKYKIQYVYRWLLLNIFLTYLMTIFNTDPVIKNYFILYLSYYLTALLLFKTIFAILEHCYYYFYQRMYYESKVKEKKKEYNERSKDLMRYIDNIKKNLNKESYNFNLSTVSIRYEDNFNKIREEIKPVPPTIEEENSQKINEKIKYDESIAISQFNKTKHQGYNNSSKYQFGTSTRYMKSMIRYQMENDKKNLLINNVETSINYKNNTMESGMLDTAFNKINPKK